MIKLIQKNFFEKINSKQFQKNKIHKKESDIINYLRYTSWYINLVSFILSIFIFSIFSQCTFHFEFPKKAILKAGFSVNITQYQEASSSSNLNSDPIQEESNWHLEIPSIYLKANIAEGTSVELMSQFIGHFEETKRWDGNVCLAAHNRGYKKNYFSDLKKLKKGDKIIYHYQKNRRKYEVERNEIIEYTDLSCLENTEDNVLTLITCVENEPKYRRCVRAIENK